MIVEVNKPKNSRRIHIDTKKLYFLLKKNVFIILLVLITVFIVFSWRSIEDQLSNLNPRQIILVEKLSFESTILGALIGSLLAIFGGMWSQSKINHKKSIELSRNYARIIKADIERTERLFKNKRFNLIKLSSVTILKNWFDVFGNISLQLSKDELQQLINYYTQIQKLEDYERKINQHLDAMQCGILKDYPHMKEYNDLISNFGVEVNILFKIDINKLKEKLDKVCS
ncbi:MAG: hypothetical protein Q8936_12285 [Bacillota bacterium]|nr:hypothetical protein [Bacillota bacterium]